MEAKGSKKVGIYVTIYQIGRRRTPENFSLIDTVFLEFNLSFVLHRKNE